MTESKRGAAAQARMNAEVGGAEARVRLLIVRVSAQDGVAQYAKELEEATAKNDVNDTS